MSIPSIPNIPSMPSIGGGVEPPTNLITNGQFNANITGWTTENGTGEWDGAEGIPPGSAHFEAETPADSAGYRTTDFIALAAGTTVRATAFFKNNLASTQLSIRIVQFDSGFNFIETAADDDTFLDSEGWKSIVLETTLVANTAHVRVYGNTWGEQAADFNMDSVSLYVT